MRSMSQRNHLSEEAHFFKVNLIQKTQDDTNVYVMSNVLIFMLFTDVPHGFLTAKKWLYHWVIKCSPLGCCPWTQELYASHCAVGQHKEAIVEYFPLLGVDLFGWPHSALQQSSAVHHVEVVEEHSDHTDCGEQIKCDKKIFVRSCLSRHSWSCNKFRS